MKKRNILYLMAAALLTGCSADEQPDNVKGLVPITLNTLMVEGNLTRNTAENLNVQSTNFDEGQTFYAYFPENVTAGTLTTGSHAVFTTALDGSTTADPQPYFNAGEITSATVHAYYPYFTEDGGKQVTNATTSFSVEKNQNFASGYRKSDLMYATATIPKSAPTGTLLFTHKMAKIIVNASAADGLTITDVRIVGGNRTINIETPQTCTLGTSLSNANSTTDYITMFTGGNNNTAVCAALLPPQTLSGSNDFIEIVTKDGNNTEASAKYRIAKTIESANSYTLNLTVTRASLNNTTAISNWSNNSASTSLGDLVIGEIEDIYFFDDETEKNYTPEPVVTCNGNTLIMGEDYEVLYFNNTSLGSGIVLVIGKGDYEGKSANRTFSIQYPTISQASKDYIGSVICSNGHLHSTVSKATTAGCTPCAIIAYYGEAGDVDESSDTYKGLAIALDDCSSSNCGYWNGSYATESWCSQYTEFCTSIHTEDVATAVSYKNGIIMTDALVNHTNHTHHVAKSIRSYNVVIPNNCSNWFLPSVGQWNLIVNGLTNTTATFTKSSNYSLYYNSCNVKIQKAGGTNLKQDYYWASNEYTAHYRWVYRADIGAADFDNGHSSYLRAVFAF